MRKLRSKIFALTLGTMLSTAFILTAWEIRSLSTSMESEFQLRGLFLARNFMSLAAESLSKRRTDSLQEFLGLLMYDPDVAGAYLLDVTGKTIVFKSWNQEDVSLDRDLFKKAVQSFAPQFVDRAEGKRYYKIIYQRLWSESREGIKTTGVCILKLDHARIDEQVRAMALMDLSVIAVLTLIVVVLSYFLSTQIAKSLEQLKSAVQAVSRGDFSVTVSLKQKDEIGSLADSLNSMSKSLAAMTTENTLFFASLKEEKNKLDTVFTQMQTPAVLTEEDGKILLANNAAALMLQVNRNSPGFLPKQCENLFSTTPSLEKVLKSKESIVEFEAVREKPKKIILAGTACRIQPGNSGAAQWLFLWRDVTQERQEDLLKRSFMSIISHKLYTPLTIFKGYAQLLMEENVENLSPMVHKAVQNMIGQSNALARLLDRLMRFVLLQELDKSRTQFKTTDMGAVIQDSVRSLDKRIRDEHVQMTLNTASEAKVQADAQLLKNAVSELIDNAIKFSAEGARRVSVSTEIQEERIIVHVRDEGPGIPPEDQERILSEFYQVEPTFTGQMEGWGIGLAFAKKVVEFHGGKLWIESKIGAGTCVSFSLAKV